MSGGDNNVTPFEALENKASDAAMSVRMVSGMMAGVAESLTTTSRELEGYESHVTTARKVSTVLQDEMKRLLEVADRIATVLSDIEKVALQTRLLAFNATMEAARAGEQGRGFAVVAGSVKDLAHQTQEAREAIRNIGRAAHTTGDQSRALDGSLESICAATRTFISTLTEQAEVSSAACRYVDDAAGAMDDLTTALKTSPANP